MRISLFALYCCCFSASLRKSLVLSSQSEHPIIPETGFDLILPHYILSSNPNKSIVLMAIKFTESRLNDLKSRKQKKHGKRVQVKHIFFCKICNISTSMRNRSRHQLSKGHLINIASTSRIRRNNGTYSSLTLADCKLDVLEIYE